MLPMVWLPPRHELSPVPGPLGKLLGPIHPSYPSKDVLFVDSPNLKDLGHPFVRWDAHAHVSLILDRIGIRHIDKLTACVACVVHLSKFQHCGFFSSQGATTTLTPEALVPFRFRPLLRRRHSIVHIQLLAILELPFQRTNCLLVEKRVRGLREGARHTFALL